jgi:chromate transporter
VTRLALYFLRLGATGFGGPIALVGYMQRDLVERAGGFTPRQFADALAFSQLAPGPLAAQLAMYLGWVRGRVRGATLAGLAFVAPSFVMVLGLAALYARYGGLPWMRGAFYGVAAAVVAIIARSAVRLTRMTLGRDALLWTLAIGNAVAVVVTGAELLWMLLVSGAVALAASGRGAAAPSAALALVWPFGLVPDAGRLADVFWFFTQAGSVVFGSGLAIVPFLHGGVVGGHGWLTERQFLDAIAVGMITPGPVVITVAFVGYLAAGPWGAVLAALGVFLPVYAATVLGAPHFGALVRSPGVRAFVEGVTAAATGAIGGAAIVLARRAIPDLPAAVIAVVALAVLVRFRRVPEPVLVVTAAAAGVALGRP